MSRDPVAEAGVGDRPPKSAQNPSETTENAKIRRGSVVSMQSLSTSAFSVVSKF